MPAPAACRGPARKFEALGLFGGKWGRQLGLALRHQEQEAFRLQIGYELADRQRISDGELPAVPSQDLASSRAAFVKDRLVYLNGSL